ncbi:MAG: hypothetical protein HY359_00075 [Candidatus Rokubacteria bacterium]|nr:hypothetical protein [Candidatus Rokubacteria bacterium]
MPATSITRPVWWNVPDWLAAALYLVTAVALALTAWVLWRDARVWRRGRSVSGAARAGWGRALRRVAREVLGHRGLLEDPGAGWAHLLLFYGFVGLSVGTCLVFVHDKLAPFLFGAVYLAFSFALECAGLAFLAGVGWALWRRFGAARRGRGSACGGRRRR